MALGLGGLQSGGTRAGVVQRLNAQFTPVGTGNDVTEDLLMSFSLPAGSLSPGMAVRISAWGDGQGNAGQNTVKLYFGATVIHTNAFTAATACVWKADAMIVCSAASAQVANALIFEGTAEVVVPINTSPAEAVSGAILIKATGTNGAAAANNIRQLGLVVELLG